MQKLLQTEYEAFFQSYERPLQKALRINPLKTSEEAFEAQVDWKLRPVPWEPMGRYYDATLKEEQDGPGKHPFHQAGVYYIQEPSAMAPVAYLDPQPGERILDLCAAPGGKTTQIGARMDGLGVLVCNEIHPARAKILSENIERFGIRNAYVCNETPQKLEKAFPEYFHRILVDAPCSGEGMFRKNEEAEVEWSPDVVEMCAGRQREILECAVHMLLPGGRLVYSTCTFAPAENEETIQWLLDTFPEMELVDTEKIAGMEGGRVEFLQKGNPDITKTIRLWPHKVDGEGHFLAVLKKVGELEDDESEGLRIIAEGYDWPIEQECIPAKDLNTRKKPGKEKSKKKEKRKQNGDGMQPIGEWQQFRKEALIIDIPTRMLLFGEQLYCTPDSAIDIQGLKVLRPGLHLGTLKKNRLEPSHALALALTQKDVVHSCSFLADSTEIKNYLQGQTFSYTGENGWYLICVEGYSIGWGKCAGGMMKNHYPKGLRK